MTGQNVWHCLVAQRLPDLFAGCLTVGNGGLPIQCSLKTFHDQSHSFSSRPSTGGSLFETNLENEGSVSGSDSTFYRQSEGKVAQEVTAHGRSEEEKYLQILSASQLHCHHWIQLCVAVWSLPGSACCCHLYESIIQIDNEPRVWPGEVHALPSP